MKDFREPLVKQVANKPKSNLEEGKSGAKVGSSLLCMSSFLQEAEEARELYALVSTIGINNIGVPTEVEPLLKEFNDLSSLKTYHWDSLP